MVEESGWGIGCSDTMGLRTRGSRRLAVMGTLLLISVIGTGSEVGVAALTGQLERCLDTDWRGDLRGHSGI